MHSSLLGLVLVFSSSPTAEKVVADAATLAGKEGKNVLVYFKASWCSWCRKTDSLLKHPDFEKKFTDSYVIAKITIRERDEKRALENPGWANALLSIRGSKDQDVPYLAVLDEKGKKLGDGLRFQEGKVPGNGGYPKSVAEADAFVDLIRKTGKAFREQDLIKLRAYFLPQ